MKIDETILKKALQQWGTESQLELAIEELLELALALQKLKRLRGDHLKKMKNVFDEMADVRIMFAQLEIIFKPYENQIDERTEFKMKRLEERIKENLP